MALRVLHLSTYGRGGGAGRAAAALNQALDKSGIDSHLVCARGNRFTVARAADRALRHLQSSPIQTWRSPAYFGSLSADHINSSYAHVVNLHWVTDGFLSIKEIGRITKPIVWSMYDMWPFTGTEHYGIDTPQARWRSGYTPENRRADESGWDLDRSSWERKKDHWSPMHMVPASSWLADATRASELMRSWPVTRIPHVVNDLAFAPLRRSEARQMLGLNPDTPYVVFLASAGIADERKGFDLLVQSLAGVRSEVQGVELLIVGPASLSRSTIAGVPARWLGPVSGDAALRTVYGAASVVAVPSREDNMPLTAMEAQTCGRAVVGFDIGGLPEIVRHNETGFLVPGFESDSLAAALSTAIADSQSSDLWGQAAREHAVATWSPSAVVPQYVSIYTELAT